MRKNILVLFIATLVSSIAIAQSSNNSVGATVDIINYDYCSSSDSVDVDINFNFNLEDLNIKSKRSVVFKPTIFKLNTMLELPSLVIQRRGSAKLNNRVIKLNNRKSVEEYNNFAGTPYRVINYYGKERKEIINNNGVVSYKMKVPYESWMQGSELLIPSSTYGCCKVDDNGVFAPQNNRLSIEVPTIESYKIVPRLSLIKPEKVAVKRRDIEYTSALSFNVNSTTIVPSLMNNQKELHSIDSIMNYVVSDGDFTITAVNITGYASPEGTLKYNQMLSEKRANALYLRLKDEYNIKPSLYNVDFGGENWDALIPLIEADKSMKEFEKYEALDIIKNVAILNGRESKLMKLNGGNTYRYLLKNYFPQVRVVVVSVEFNVDAYDLDRIGEVIYSRPENLSLEEMYRLSETFETGSKEFINVFLTAVKVYPNDQIALNNAMATEMEAGNLDVAKSLASSFKEDSSSAHISNTLGAYYMMIGEYDKAESLLKQALNLGSPDAQHNLGQLEAKLKNIKEIEENEQLRLKIYGE